MPLDRDAGILSEQAGLDCKIVLLGSVATPKYVDPLLEVFGGRLLFPAEFVARGDKPRWLYVAVYTIRQATGLHSHLHCDAKWMQTSQTGTPSAQELGLIFCSVKDAKNRVEGNS